MWKQAEYPEIEMHDVPLQPPDSGKEMKNTWIEFVRIGGIHWLIKTFFEEAKGKIGFDYF